MVYEPVDGEGIGIEIIYETKTKILFGGQLMLKKLLKKRKFQSMD